MFDPLSRSADRGRWNHGGNRGRVQARRRRVGVYGPPGSQRFLTNDVSLDTPLSDFNLDGKVDHTDFGTLKDGSAAEPYSPRGTERRTAAWTSRTSERSTRASVVLRLQRHSLRPGCWRCSGPRCWHAKGLLVGDLSASLLTMEAHASDWECPICGCCTLPEDECP